MLVFRLAVESCACPAMSVRARWVPGARGRRESASLRVKQSGSTSSQYHIIESRAWFGHKTTPKMKDFRFR